MKLLKLLETKVVENKYFSAINEVSEKLKKQLLNKFSSETEDGAEIIVKYIDAFDTYKNGLPVDRRDINKYSYTELKDLITSKEQAKIESGIFDSFKKREKRIDRVELKKYIRRYLDIFSELPKNQRDYEKMEFLSLVSLVDKFYSKLLTKKLIDKFTKENPNLTIPQITFYTESYLQDLDDFPNEGKRVGEMSFSEFEHLVDGAMAKKGGMTQRKDDYGSVEMVYDDNNLKVFAPKTKDQCIKLRNGRSWCTSREGGSNLYYNYRLDNERTLYYVIDEDLPFKDLNFASVILVDPSGGMALADGSNSGKYSGHSNIPWKDIVSKIPKLKDLKHLFEPKPLTDEEKEQIRKVKNVRIGDNPMEAFDTPQMVELWLEINTPNLNTNQYLNLPIDLKKKYIALGQQLNSEQLKNSEPEVLSYYVNKQIDSIKEKNLRNLSSEDITLLNLPMMKKIKEELKSRFILQMGSSKSSTEVEIRYPSSEMSKFIALYGMDSIFETLSNDIESFTFENTSNDELNLKLPKEISKYKNLSILVLSNCISELPESVCELPNLRFLTLEGNKNLTSIPECVGRIPELVFLSLRRTGVKTPPSTVRDRAADWGDGLWDFTK